MVDVIFASFYPYKHLKNYVWTVIKYLHNRKNKIQTLHVYIHKIFMQACSS